MEQLSHNHKRSDNPLYASSEEMEMEPLSGNYKRVLTRSDSLPPRMEMGDSSNIGYGQFSEEVVDTSQIKSHSQEISSQTDPHMDRFFKDDLENNKDLLEKSYPKDRFQETIPPSEHPIGENMSAIEGRAPDIFHLKRENSSDRFQEAIPLSKHPIGENMSAIEGRAPDIFHLRRENSLVIEQDQGEVLSRAPSVSFPRRRRPVSPPLRSRFEGENWAEYLKAYAVPSYYVYASEDGIATTSTTDTTSTTATTSGDDFENDDNANTANLARPKPPSPKPGDIKNTNQETLSKEKDNRAISAQLDDVNYTRASNVTLSNFVSVKLSGKSNYEMWKAQMECLMKSHKMRGLVIKEKELPVNKNIELRERYEILLNGWLIGSLSEEIIKDKRIYDKGAKGIWDTLERSYDPYAISPTASTLLKPRNEKEIQGTSIELKLIKKLHNATLEGRWWKAKSILNDHKDNGAATWKVNANCDTLLHVAVRLGNNYFLKELLDIIETGKEIDTVNSERHTALHIAAIVGNKEAAELLVKKNDELLSIKDNDENIPLACAYFNKQVNAFVYLWGATKESDREGFRTEYEEKEKEKAKENENENENENDKDKKEEEENEKEKENENEKEKEIEEGKENENEKEKEIEEGKENEIEEENENEKDKRKEENEKEKGKEEGKENEIKKQIGKQNKTEEVKQKEKEQRRQKFGQSLLNAAIYNKQYDLAKELVNINPHLAKQSSTLVVLTQNFPSQISFTETLMYPSFNDVCHKLVKRSFLPLDSLEYLYARAGGTLWKVRRFKKYSSLFPTLVISLLVPAAVLHLIYRLLCLLILLLRFPFSMLYFILWKVLSILVVPIKNIEKKKKEHKKAKKFLKWICSQNSLNDENSKDSLFDKFYKESLMEAACLDVYEVLDQILKLSSNAMKVKNKDGHNIIQLAVINRSAKVYNLLSPIIERKRSYRRVMDAFGNNLLHLAGRLAPLAVLSCTSGAALQLQRELQWREEVKKLMEPTQHTKKNVDYETPEMVFSREHANLVKEGEKWMKTTAESCSITAALIITIVFAAAITVPGGSNQETGIPLFKRKIAFNIFAVADAISLFSASTSLLVFLSILTTRFAEKDFLISLPRRLFVGLCLLFLSTTAMMLAFSTILFLVFCEERPWMLAPIGGLTCFPIAAIVTLQLPLVIDLYQATFITIFEQNEEDEEGKNREEEKEDEKEDKEKLNEEVDNKKQAKKEEEEGEEKLRILVG